ncbi:MAG TPA: SDR family oxidoreductase [Gemmatimonadaceae bacterium]|nr:SDR family oxidoreductase [Gemmatimonadaceae bacterium]
MALPRMVLVTGATGLVGGGVLRQMLAEDLGLEAFALYRDDCGWKRLSRELGALADRVVPVCGDVTLPHLGLEPLLRRRVELQTSAIVHAAADTSFSRTLARSLAVNTIGTEHVVALALNCRRLDHLSFVSTAFVAGRATGLIAERDNGGAAGWVNAYEQSKYEAERIVRESDLPWTILRSSTIVCRNPLGEISQINAVHRALRIYHRGLAAMMPGDRSNPLDVVTASFVIDAIARLTCEPRAREKTLHLCAGRNALTLGELIDTAYDVWAAEPGWRKRRVERALITDTGTYELFERTVHETGDARLRAILTSLSYFIPQLALPKVFDTSVAEELLGAAPPCSREFWVPMLEQLVVTNWGHVVREAA